MFRLSKDDVLDALKGTEYEERAKALTLPQLKSIADELRNNMADSGIWSSLIWYAACMYYRKKDGVDNGNT